MGIHPAQSLANQPMLTDKGDADIGLNDGDERQQPQVADIGNRLGQGTKSQFPNDKVMRSDPLCRERFGEGGIATPKVIDPDRCVCKNKLA